MDKWDQFWFNMCSVVATNSKCLSRQVGAIIVADGKHSISGGYNGPVAGALHCDDERYRDFLYGIRREEFVGVPDFEVFGTEDLAVCPRRVMGFKTGEGREYCQAAHAEINAVANAARYGHSSAGRTIYMNCGVPCFECAKVIVNAGIKEVVCTDFDCYEEKGLTGLDILKQGKVLVRIFDV